MRPALRCRASREDDTMTDRDPAQMRTDLGRNLTYGLLDALGRSIVTGHYDKRIFPTEAALAKQHSVSRSVTREAVKMLTAKGLLSARPRQGTIIQPTASWNLFDPDVLRWLLERKFSVELLRHFNQLRVAIEPEAAALAASHADAAQLEAIGEGLARMEEAEKGHDSTLDADIAFHIAVLQASNNPFFLQFRDVVRTALRSSIRSEEHSLNSSHEWISYAVFCLKKKSQSIPSNKTKLQKIRQTR